MIPAHWHITTLAYVICGGQIALLRRLKEPNLGLWSPPGGKLAPGESPIDGALRELREETGLVGEQPRLAAVVSEIDTVRGEAWLMFCVRVDVREALPMPAHCEGEPRWVPLSDVPSLATPQADASILAAVLEAGPGVAFLSVRYSDGRLISLATRRTP